MTDINTVLSSVLYLVIIIAVPMLIKGLDSVVEEKKKEIIEASKSEYFEATKEKAIEIIQDTVDCVAQTYVDELKKQGKFDKDRQKEAFNKVLEKVKILLGDEVRSTLATVYTDFDEWLAVQIEAYIRSTKVTIAE